MQHKGMRLLDPASEDAVRAAWLRGTKARSLAVAYGVSTRVIYRTIHRAHREVVRTMVGPYSALFELGDDGPIQLTRWSV